MTPKQFAAKLRKHGSLKKVAENEGMTWYRTQKLYTEARDAGLVERLPLGKRPGTGKKAPGNKKGQKVGKTPIDTPEQFVEGYKKHGSIQNMARAYGLKLPVGSNSKLFRLYKAAIDKKLMDYQPMGRKTREEEKTPKVHGHVQAIKTTRVAVPRSGTKHFILTSAQNNTHIHEPLWRNLEVLREKLDAKMYVARFTYKKEAYGSKAVKPGKGPTADDMRALWYEPRLEPHINDARVEIAPGLVWCGEFNRLPTASNPLGGFESYTGRKSGIFPHVKFAMESIASMQSEPTKFNYTTGTITLRNYIQKSTGLKAEFHHGYGALLVEVDSRGRWYVRQLNADSEGTIYDLETRVRDGRVQKGRWVEAINWGDVHVDEMAPEVDRMAWDGGGMLDTLRPRRQFLHDVVSFMGPSHHNLRDPYRMYMRHQRGQVDVGAEFRRAGEWVTTRAVRDWCETISVDSNHHHHVGRWLKEVDGRKDMLNARYWSALNEHCYNVMDETGREPNYLKEALKVAGFPDVGETVRFLDEDESYVICPDANGGIECGLHGHDGPNGARGSTRGYIRMGRKVNKGHDHTATIMDGVYSAGTCSRTNPDWVHGPGGWTWSHIVTYENGKRQIITMYDNKWRA